MINKADHALALTEKPRFDFTALLANPEKLSLFLTACHALKPLEQQASDRLKQYLHENIKVPGWHLVSRGPGKYVEPSALLPLIDKLGPEPVLTEHGNLSFIKYERLCRAAELNPDLAAVKQGAGATYLRHAPNSRKEEIP